MFPLSGTLYSLYGYRVDCITTENACAVLAPGQLPNKTVVDIIEYHCETGHSHQVLQLPNKTVVDINEYHCEARHSHQVLLRKTAEQQGVVLDGKLLVCRGCSMTKGLRKGVKQSTRTRADKKLGRVFVDLSGTQSFTLYNQQKIGREFDSR